MEVVVVASSQFILLLQCKQDPTSCISLHTSHVSLLLLICQVQLYDHSAMQLMVMEIYRLVVAWSRVLSMQQLINMFLYMVTIISQLLYILLP